VGMEMSRHGHIVPQIALYEPVIKMDRDSNSPAYGRAAGCGMAGA